MKAFSRNGPVFSLEVEKRGRKDGTRVMKGGIRILLGLGMLKKMGRG